MIVCIVENVQISVIKIIKNYRNYMEKLLKLNKKRINFFLLLKAQDL